MASKVADCVFCKIIAGEVSANHIYQDEETVVFLDSGPLFPGHCLVCPRTHIANMLELPVDMMPKLFRTAQLVAKAVERGLGAEGSFVAVNNKVSQSVPHLHVHVIPRSKGDGMKGFFWPRKPYNGDDHIAETQRALKQAIADIASSPD